MSKLSEEKIIAIAKQTGMLHPIEQEMNDAFIAYTRAIEAAVLEAQGKQEPVAWAYTINNSHSVFSAEKPPEDAYDEGTLYPLYAAPVVPPDTVLCNFYQVETFPDLVAALVHHIEKLQAKVPPFGNNWPGKVREG